MQLRLEKGRTPRKARKIMESPRFRAAYDFLLLRASAGEVDQQQADWWTGFQEQQPQPKEQKKTSGRRRYRNRGPQSSRSSA